MINILRLCSLEFFGADEFLNDLFGLREVDPFYTKVYDNGSKVSKWETSGYDTIFFIPLAGTLFFMIVGFILLVLLRALCLKLISSCGENRVSNRIRRHMNYSVIVIRFIFESCIDLGLSAMINIVSVSLFVVVFETNIASLSNSSTARQRNRYRKFFHLFAPLCAPFVSF